MDISPTDGEIARELFFSFFSPRSMISFSVSRCIFRFICLLPVGFDERKKNVPDTPIVGTSDVVNFKENEIIHARCISIKRSSISDKEFCRSFFFFFFFFLFKKSRQTERNLRAIETAPIHFAVSIFSFFDLRRIRVDRSNSREENGRGNRERERVGEGVEAVRRDVTAATRDETC